jgi:hypothetical protein
MQQRHGLNFTRQQYKTDHTKQRISFYMAAKVKRVQRFVREADLIHFAIL